MFLNDVLSMQYTIICGVIESANSIKVSDEDFICTVRQNGQNGAIFNLTKANL